MFARGSRYRNLSESSSLDAQGNHLRGKELRIIVPAPGQFLHTVSQGDRLDLLALKYYGDSTKWWQITDANPAPAFPPDLLDRQPLIEETFALACPAFDKRFKDLSTALSAFGDVGTGRRDFFDHVEERAAEFLESTVTVSRNPPPSHAGIVAAIAAQGFRLLRSFTWTQGAATIAAFTFVDEEAMGRWDRLLTELAGRPGVLGVRSTLAEQTLTLTYNAMMVPDGRRALSDAIKSAGFAVLAEPRTITRTGDTITVPPNQIV